MQARLWALAISTPMIINAVLTVVVPTTWCCAIALDVMAVVAWIRRRSQGSRLLSGVRRPSDCSRSWRVLNYARCIN
jgi:hypothetical protein